MREILFRGKIISLDKSCGNWIFGDLNHYSCDDGLFIAESACSMHRIDKITVGQYTGMKDIKDKKIFEGDIVKFKRVNALGYTTNRVGDVQYYDELPIFYIYANTGDAWDWVDCEEIEVIGNIHDNPELMERECD